VTARDRGWPAPRLDVTAQAEILDSLPLGVIVFDPELRVAYANVAAHRLLHPSRLRRGFALPVDFPAPAETLIRRNLTEEIEIGDRILRVSGTRMRRKRLSMLVLEDVSPRARRDRATREFVANAAHELLSPVTGILAAAHVLDSGAKDVPALRDRFIGHVVEAADRLARSARALLMLERAQSGQHPPRLELVPLLPLLEEVARTERGDVSVECRDDIAVLADRDLVMQAVANLVANARRHAHGDAVALNASERGDRVVAIEVTDSGAGIPPDQLQRVATRFYSGAGRDSGGYGLGLAIAAQAAEAMGGRLELESEAGRGTRVSLELSSGRVIRR
jgi:signal transduction histidine kinase